MNYRYHLPFLNMLMFHTYVRLPEANSMGFVHGFFMVFPHVQTIPHGYWDLVPPKKNCTCCMAIDLLFLTLQGIKICRRPT